MERSIDKEKNSEQMKDYFGNKINLKRSFDNKHYQGKRAIGHGSTQVPFGGIDLVRLSHNNFIPGSPVTTRPNGSRKRNHTQQKSSKLQNRSLDKPKLNFIKEN